MSDATKIEWADASWNPVRAIMRAPRRNGGGSYRPGHFCEHVSEGCRNCYAESINRRLGNGLRYRRQDRDKLEIYLDDKVLAAPLAWRRPRTIFVLSMSDLFGDFVPDAMVDKIFAVMAAAHWHRFLVLTKRPERMRRYLGDMVDAACRWLETSKRIEAIRAVGWSWAADGMPWPLPNIWLGTSAEDQKTFDARVLELGQCEAAGLFMSLEPLLGPIDLGNVLDTATPEPARGFRSYRPLGWIICGGESGPGARPMHPEWARSLRDQCQAWQVPFFFKQWGSWAPVDPMHPRAELIGEDPEIAEHECGFDMSTAASMAKLGKAKAGRLLDARLYDGVPA